MELNGDVLPGYDHWKQLAQTTDRGGPDVSANEAQLCVSFFRPGPNEARLDEVESEKQQRAVYIDEPWIHIQAPGDRKNIIKRPARLRDLGPHEPDDRRAYPNAWKRFQENSTEQAGTPLDRSGLMVGARVAEMRSLGIHTVEQLASVSESVLPRLGMGARELRERARRMVKPVDEAVVEVREENRQLREQMAAMQAQMEQLILQGQRAARQDASEAWAVPDSPDEPDDAGEAPRRRPGRPRKDAA